MAVGQLIADRYVVERKIGRGGFGAVFAARHTGTGQEVALKCLNTAAGVEDVTLRRFFQEARVTSGLRHPNTIRVFDFGQDDSGLLFLAMELLSGRSLKQELSGRRKKGKVFTEDETINVAVGILRSLAEAHAAGLVHRDLKPDNVFLHEVPGEEPIIKVLDFGIVKLGDSTITLGSDSGVPGTPAFMSPEQVTRQSIDGRSDLYSLGCLMYQLLTGQVPLRGESAMQTLYRHVHDQAEDVRTRARTPISDELATIVHKALAKDPNRRFKGAREMRAALEVCRGSELSSSLRTPMSRGPTRLERAPSTQASLFSGPVPGIEDVDASVPDISKQHLPRPRTSRAPILWLAAGALLAAAAGFGAAVMFSEERPPAAPPPPVRVEVVEPNPQPPTFDEPETAVEESPNEEVKKKPKRRRPRRRPFRRRPAKSPAKKAEPAPAPEQKYEILDEKI